MAVVGNGRLRARVVIGAGGHFCPVARLLGAKAPRLRLSLKKPSFKWMHTNSRPASSSDTPELYFCLT